MDVVDVDNNALNAAKHAADRLPTRGWAPSDYRYHLGNVFEYAKGKDWGLLNLDLCSEWHMRLEKQMVDLLKNCEWQFVAIWIQRGREKSGYLKRLGDRLGSRIPSQSPGHAVYKKGWRALAIAHRLVSAGVLASPEITYTYQSTVPMQVIVLKRSLSADCKMSFMCSDIYPDMSEEGLREHILARRDPAVTGSHFGYSAGTVTAWKAHATRNVNKESL